MEDFAVPVRLSHATSDILEGKPKWDDGNTPERPSVSIDLIDFRDVAKIDDERVGDAYFVQPLDGSSDDGGRAGFYKILHEGLRQGKKVVMAKLVAADGSAAVIIRARGPRLTLHPYPIGVHQSRTLPIRVGEEFANLIFSLEFLMQLESRDESSRGENVYQLDPNGRARRK